MLFINVVLMYCHVLYITEFNFPEEEEKIAKFLTESL